MVSTREMRPNELIPLREVPLLTMSEFRTTVLTGVAAAHGWLGSSGDRMNVTRCNSWQCLRTGIPAVWLCPQRS